MNNRDHYNFEQVFESMRGRGFCQAAKGTKQYLSCYEAGSRERRYTTAAASARRGFASFISVRAALFNIQKLQALSNSQGQTKFIKRKFRQRQRKALKSYDMSVAAI